MDVLKRLGVDYEELAALCRKYYLRRLAIFGSALTDEFGPDSDVDILVEYDREHIPGLAFFDLEDELERLFRRKVDLSTPQGIYPDFRKYILPTARELYAA